MAVSVIADPGATWCIPGEPDLRSWGRLMRLIEVTASAGAQVFKPQYYTADTLYPAGSAERGLVRPYELPASWLPGVAKRCDRHSIEFMCTVYTPEHVALINPLVRRFKISSFEAGHDGLIEAIAVTGKPVLLSLGMGQQGTAAFRACSARVTPLHCVSSYPATTDQLNMARLESWLSPKGLSDHTLGTLAPVMAVAVGASVIEHHLRADDTPAENPDYAHSYSPAEFAAYVATIRQAERAMGDGFTRAQPGEAMCWRYDPRTGRRGTAVEPTP